MQEPLYVGDKDIHLPLREVIGDVRGAINRGPRNPHEYTREQPYAITPSERGDSGYRLTLHGRTFVVPHLVLVPHNFSLAVYYYDAFDDLIGYAIYKKNEGPSTMVTIPVPPGYTAQVIIRE